MKCPASPRAWVCHGNASGGGASFVALIRVNTMNAQDAMRLALSKSRVEDPMLKTVQNLQRSIAEDTVRNEYTFHAKIHEWLAAPGAAHEVDSLNRRVYAELFLTPDSDPWLGLVPNNTFSADRFMARHISSDKRKPEVPSSEPVMI